MTRRRLLSLFALVLLLPSVLCTEAAEVWFRVALGAAADLDDDDGPSFTCQLADGRAWGVAAPRRQASADQTVHVASAVPSGGSVVDEPTFSLPQLGLVVLPAAFTSVGVPMETVARAVETRGPPTRSDRFVRPPPRAPPLS